MCEFEQPQWRTSRALSSLLFLQIKLQFESQEYKKSDFKIPFVLGVNMATRIDLGMESVFRT